MTRSGSRWKKGWVCDGRTHDHDTYPIIRIGDNHCQDLTAHSDGDHRRPGRKEESMAKAKAKRIPTRVHSRKIDRNVARVQMKKAGFTRPNKRLADNWRRFSED